MEDKNNEMVNDDVIEVNNSDNHVAVDNYDYEKKSEIKYLVTIFVFIFILMGSGISGLLMLNNSENATGSNNSINSILIDDSNVSSDENVIEDDEDSSGKIINIYQKGYADLGPIAYTYKCKSEICDIKITDKGFILYDNETVRYREMSDFEYKQINDSEISPVGGKLNLDGFKDVKMLFEERDDILVRTHVYNIDNNIYIMDVDKENLILSYDEYYNKGLNGVVVIDNLVLFDGYIYDFINDEKLYYDSNRFMISNYGKFGEFYYFDVKSSKKSFYLLVDYALKDIISVENTMVYVDKDKIYYIDTKENDESSNTVYYIDSIGDKRIVSEEKTNSFFIYKERLFYLDSENILNVKNLINNNIYNSGVIMKNKHYMLNYSDNGFEILEVDHTILKKEEFDLYRKDLGIKDKEFNLCLIDLSECPEHGNLIKLDKDGKFISKEFYYKVSTPSE